MSLFERASQVALILLAVTIATPAASSECSEGWFPDFRCEREGRFEGFSDPIVAPYLFEDPFITTGLHAYYILHEFPRNSVLADGEAHVVALQARIALTDRLALIATKDGYAWRRPETKLGGSRILDDSQGTMNIAAGLKYALFQDRDRGYIVTPALRFELPTGSSDIFQGDGDGLVIPSVSGAWAVDRLELQGGLGAQIPLDGGEQSGSVFYHLYAGWNLSERVSPFVQLSGLTWVHSGDGKLPVRLRGGAEIPLDTAQDVLGTGRFEGADVIDLGSRGVAGQDLFTWSAGAHLPLGRFATFSFAYERPFSHQKGLYKQRFITALALEF